jgi:hypothetical protein
MLFTLAKCVRRSCVWAKTIYFRQLTKMCRTLIDVAAFSFPLPDSPLSLPFPLPLPVEDDFDGMLMNAEIYAATCRFGIYMRLFSHIRSMLGGKTFPQGARLARCERDQNPKNKRGEMRNIQSGVTHQRRKPCLPGTSYVVSTIDSQQA